MELEREKIFHPTRKIQKTQLPKLRFQSKFTRPAMKFPSEKR